MNRAMAYFGSSPLAGNRRRGGANARGGHSGS